MNYKLKSIEELEQLSAEFYEQETAAHEERAKVVAVLRLKIKEREASGLVDEALLLHELAKANLEMTWFEKFRAWLGI